MSRRILVLPHKLEAPWGHFAAVAALYLPASARSLAGICVQLLVLCNMWPSHIESLLNFVGSCATKLEGVFLPDLSVAGLQDLSWLAQNYSLFGYNFGSEFYMAGWKA